ncbi:hypothetical protein rosag_11240 [Roseisolibacter agri]|uniref:Carboxypeptidase regulatory-like domain-containing protein n=1 Tax=Roseisolibacter agri TaxID=2014610 RepID=A0AA37V5W2_9BACT|nr:hypothetical protein rosag_11240 [Roseisolibacter agri]
MKRRPAARPAALLALALTPCVTACPTPISRTEVRAVAVVGRFVREDGTPVPGTAVAVSTERGDSTCARGGARAVTDASGGFALSTLERRHYRVTWIVPGLDLARPGYVLCLAPSGDTLPRRAYSGDAASRGPAKRDTIACVEWTWHGRKRVTCAGEAVPAIITGGRWTSGEVVGFYRVLLALEQMRVPGYRVPVPRIHAYVQWVEPGETGRPAVVRATVAVPVDPRVDLQWWGNALIERDGAWYLRLDGTRKRFLNSFSPTSLAFALGPPGEVAVAPRP